MLQSSQTSGSGGSFRQRASFTHYGFLVVDSWCAYGVHIDVLTSMRASLSVDAGPFIDSIVQSEQAENVALTYEHTKKAGETGFPRAGQRVLKTWPVNSLWSECLLDLGLNDSAAVTAEDQVHVLLDAKGWRGQDSCLPAFMSIVQLWYYGMLTEKVCCVNVIKDLRVL